MKCGKLTVIIGPMFSGKTTTLMRYHNDYSFTKLKPICINYIKDDRYGEISENNMYNHNLSSVKCIYAEKLENISDMILGYDVILINEGQFFSDLVKYCRCWMEEHGKIIVVAGLDGDYKREMFGEILKLIPYAQKVEKLSAMCSICSDGTEAHYTFRKSDEINQIVIGSSNYMALCADCYKIESKKKSTDLQV